MSIVAHRSENRRRKRRFGFGEEVKQRFEGLVARQKVKIHREGSSTSHTAAAAVCESAAFPVATGPCCRS